MEKPTNKKFHINKINFWKFLNILLKKLKTFIFISISKTVFYEKNEKKNEKRKK